MKSARPAFAKLSSRLTRLVQIAPASQILTLARGRCRLFSWRFKWRQMLRIPATRASRATASSASPIRMHDVHASLSCMRNKSI